MSKGRRTGITMNKKLGSTLIAMTIIIFMLFLTLGMFTKKFGGSASAEIAKAQTSIVEGKLLDVNAEDNNSIDATNTGGYYFSIKNTDETGNQTTEVNMKYKIVVETVKTDSNGNVTYNGNINYELYKANIEDADNPTTEGNAMTSTKDESGNDVFSTEDMILKTNEEQQDKKQVESYVLKFTPENDGQFHFKVKVISEQID